MNFSSKTITSNILKISILILVFACAKEKELPPRRNPSDNPNAQSYDLAKKIQQEQLKKVKRQDNNFDTYQNYQSIDAPISLKEIKQNRRRPVLNVRELNSLMDRNFKSRPSKTTQEMDDSLSEKPTCSDESCDLQKVIKYNKAIAKKQKTSDKKDAKTNVTPSNSNIESNNKANGKVNLTSNLNDKKDSQNSKSSNTNQKTNLNVSNTNSSGSKLTTSGNKSSSNNSSNIKEKLSSTPLSKAENLKSTGSLPVVKLNSEGSEPILSDGQTINNNQLSVGSKQTTSSLPTSKSSSGNGAKTASGTLPKTTSGGRIYDHAALLPVSLPTTNLDEASNKNSSGKSSIKNEPSKVLNSDFTPKFSKDFLSDSEIDKKPEMPPIPQPVVFQDPTTTSKADQVIANPLEKTQQATQGSSSVNKFSNSSGKQLSDVYSSQPLSTQTSQFAKNENKEGRKINIVNNILIRYYYALKNKLVNIFEEDE